MTGQPGKGNRKCTSYEFKLDINSKTETWQETSKTNRSEQSRASGDGERLLMKE